MLHTGILVGERGDERRVGAIRIELRVQRALGEGGHLPRKENVIDGACAVLQYERRVHAAFNENVDFSAARVRVRGVEATRTEESDCHRGVGANERRKRLAGGGNGRAARANSVGVRGWGKEIEDKVAVFGDCRDAVGGFGGKEKRFDSIEVVGKAIDWFSGGACGRGGRVN